MSQKHGILAVKTLMLALFLAGVGFADFTIPAGQPICNLYGIIQIVGTAAGVLMGAYAGFTLASSHEMTERNNAKALLGGVVIGLIIIWMAPIVVQNLVGSTGVCGW